MVALNLSDGSSSSNNNNKDNKQSLGRALVKTQDTVAAEPAAGTESVAPLEGGATSEPLNGAQINYYDCPPDVPPDSCTVPH